MKILYLAHRLPHPPNKGDKIRSFNTIKCLAGHHDVWCACFVDDPRDFRHVASLGQYCREVVAIPLNRTRAACRAVLDLLLDETATEGFYRDRAMKHALWDLAERVSFDVVLVFSSSMAQYAREVPAKRRVIDFCDLDSRKWADSGDMRLPPKSWLLHTEARRLAKLERRLHDEFDASVLIGAHEARGWNITNREKLHFIGNGVELPTLPQVPRYAALNVGFVGDMSYFPNEDAVCWFVRRIWPTVVHQLPDARFDIVGRSPSRTVRRLERTRGVRVVGSVHDVREHLMRFQVVVAPLRIARGIQNKVLEAMATARPVVATSAAAAGINGVPGTHLLVEDDPGPFAAAILRMLRDPSACRTMGGAARALVAADFNWGHQMALLEEILRGQALSKLKVTGEICRAAAGIPVCPGLPS